MESGDKPPKSDVDAVPAIDMCHGLRFFLVLDLFARLFIWSVALTGAIWTFNLLGAWPASPITNTDLGNAWLWAGRLANFVLLFNLLYVVVLIVLRLLVPTPKEGEYSTAGRVPDRQILFSTFVAVLTKARYQAPFPGFLVFHAANLPPLVWLMRPIFGPNSRSCYVLEPNILDPHMVTLGRNVVIGFGSTIAGHYQQRDKVVFARTVIEDNVLIGGHAAIPGGVHIGAGAVVGTGSVVLPHTKIGPNEYWSGAPARRRRELPAVGDEGESA
ncbi:MAG: hypothetical protein JXO22_08135 [Phycisphaerae bacterium]|nr:hypothetical protein [Phycisphaerae bacterium]